MIKSKYMNYLLWVVFSIPCTGYSAGQSSISYCSLKSLKGTYIYSGQGMKHFKDKPGYQYFPYFETGLEIYDGNGHVTNYYGASDAIEMIQDTATYTINKNCEGTVQYSSGDVFNIYVTPTGDGFTFIQTSGSDKIYSGEEDRVSKTTTPRCSNKTLKGTYNYFGQGGDLSYLLFLETGMETYDGNGKMSNLYTDSKELKSVSDSATYSINSNCIGTVSYESGENYKVFASPIGDSFVYIQNPNGNSILSGREKRISNKLILPIE